ncbi:hypothetical protein M413DRAFT_441337 [Hebeloma cylindrosporum]|uniref:FAD-binding PCMH-type domain-containing protein n=1 Tax=Hebeloma cylindrosporum TaxID=76867 RepID=A0A0C3CQV5_HEBCY|nr:hypothetical protein M413DRAFT_441337 [Hebeloma cylindrosporum h7]
MADLNIATLQQELKGEVITAEHPGYAKAISRWAANAERRAKVVVFVKDSKDVVAALDFAKANGLSIAVRGGGHHAAGASSIEDGLVIDLSHHMNKVKVDPSKKLAYVGGGALWEAVDKEAIRHGLATVAGTVNHTGVGGLVLGGGYGWLSASHGLVIDNLVQATVVTANGSILSASDSANTDLFFAIRGGGGNFGVVTEFVFQLHPQRPTVYSGIILFPASALEKLIKVTNEWWITASEKESMLQITTFDPDGNPIVALFPFFNGPESEGREKFKPFLDIGPLADMSKEIPFEEVNGLQNSMAAHGRGVYQKGVGHKHFHYPSIAKAHEKLQELIKTTGSYQGAILYEYFPLHKVNSVSRDATAFQRELVPNALVILTWDHKAGDCSGQARQLANELASIVVGVEPDITPSEALGYSNYDPEGAFTENGKISAKAIEKAKHIFGDNYQRLQEIKKRYDPDNIFNKWFPIIPA